MAIAAGTRLGPYEILAPLGEGGMGEVYRARDPRLGRDVAIKVLPAQLADDADRVRRFEHEARAVGRLNHPNIVAVHDIGRVPEGLPASGAPFLVVELLEGRTLRDQMQGRAVPWRTALGFARGMAEGLAAAHDKGVIHRDLKPENVFVTRDGQIKILDFGLAKLRPDAKAAEIETATANATDAGVVMGTTAYMSPEQVRAQDVDHCTDIFSFGSVLYEMLTGRRTFHGATAAETMGAILHLDPAAMGDGSPTVQVPPALERIVRRCFEKSPERRFQSARDLAFSLETLMDPTDVAATAAPSRPPDARQRALSPRLRFLLLLAAGLGVAAAAGWLLWSLTNRPSSPASTSASTTPPSMTPFLAGPAVETMPAWSPTSNLVAYVSDAGSNNDVWMSDLTGANPINLTKDHAGTDAFPAWAPDGQHVAFYSDRDGGGIYTMTPLGANIRRVTLLRPSVYYTFSLQWAPDGSLIYTNFDDVGEKRIYRVLPTEGKPVCLTCGGTITAAARAGALSPSGKLLAYVGSLMGPRPPLFVLELSSGHNVRLADRADAPQWRDDGHLMFLSARDGFADLWEIAIDSKHLEKAGEPVRLTSALDATAFAVSRDGRELLAVKAKSSSSIWRFPTQAARIDSLSQGTALTTGDFRDERPRWSADNRDVFFDSNRRASVNVWRVSATGGVPVRLTNGVGLESRPRPSPDGQWITFDMDGNWTWLMRPDGSGAHAPANWQERYINVCCPAWSPNSRRVVLTVNDKNDENRLAVADLDPATATFVNVREVDMPGTLEEYGRWSPDGRGLVFETFTEGSFDLWLADGDGKSPRRVTNLPGNERSAAWQASPLHLYFRDEQSLWRMPMADALTPSGSPVRWLSIAGVRADGDGIDISRDSKHILVSLTKPESDIWLVERK